MDKLSLIVYILCLFQCKLDNVTAETCTDSLSVSNPHIFTVTNSKGENQDVTYTNCKKLFKTYPAECEKAGIGGINGSCCKTCGDTACMDKLTKKAPLITQKHFLMPTLKIQSCKTLVKKYRSLCKEEGKKGGNCCRKCKQVKDIDCLDDFRVPASVDVMGGETSDNCSSYISLYPCRCADDDTRESCCQTCKSIDIKSLNCDCEDTYNPQLRPSIRMTIDILYRPDPETMLSLVYKNMEGCSEIADWYPTFCNQGMCCRSCKGIDTSCVDNLFWKVNVTSSEHECMDCNCHDVYKVSPQLMNHVCDNNIKGTNLPSMGAREACCHQCSRVGYSKPKGYKASKLLDYMVQLVG